MWNVNCVFVVISIASINCWKLPELPTNKRVQYFLVQNDGGYKYGFDTGNGYFGKQIGDSKNEVFGHYAYPVEGKLVDVRYTSGVNGFIPEGYPNLKDDAAVKSQWDSSSTDDTAYISYSTGEQSHHESSGQVQGEYAYTDETGKQYLYSVANSEQSGNSDGSYSFQYDAGDHSRQESSDASGNVKGSFSYQNKEGQHDLSYVAGADTGFIVTGGSLAPPAPEASSSWSILNTPTTSTSIWTDRSSSDSQQSDHSDGSYSFQYDAGDHSRQESSDASGNVKGSFSYQNEAGQHDLSYIAGADTGFVVTGGSLAPPAHETSSSWSTLITPAISTSTWVSHVNSADPSDAKTTSWENHGTNTDKSDGSYSFEYNTGNHYRKESADKDGHVQGKYGYKDEAGHHDLSYKAGDHYGFIVTGGNLAEANIKTKKTHSCEKSTIVPFEVETQTITADSVTSQDESESSSQINQDESTDVTTVSGGSQFNIVVEDTTIEEEAITISKSSKKSDHDGSYSFEYDTGNHYRKESADKDGHVQGKYGYKDEAGHHDLSYKAGDDYGFIVTGGNLAEKNLYNKVHPLHKSVKPTTLSSGIEINTITADSITVQAESATSWDVNQGISDSTTESGGTQWNTNIADSTVDDDYQEITESSKNLKDHDDHDGSYNFEYDTGNHYRKESADKNGHVQGKYGYKDEAGHHDLSYKAGDDYGFIATGGSLAEPNGLKGKTIPDSSLKDLEGSGQSGTDGSYSFQYNAGDHTRQESSDSSGNVKGSFSYQNEAGQHDLSYISGPETGFVVTGGNLVVPNNNINSITENSESVGNQWKPVPVPKNVYLPPLETSTSYTLGDVHVKQYFPSKGNAKFGYVFESKH